MKTVTTSKGASFPADYCGVGYMGQLKLQVHDTRPLAALAQDFEGAETVTFTRDGADTVFAGYTRLMRAEVVSGELRMILLAQPDEVEE